MKKVLLALALFFCLQTPSTARATDVWVGWKTCTKDESLTFYECPLCKQQKIHILSSRLWFTITMFSIPIFPLGRKSFHFGCACCGSSYPVHPDLDVYRLIKEFKEYEKDMAAIKNVKVAAS